MAELNHRDNPNNTATYRRREGPDRERDNDGNSYAAADRDYFGNLKRFERHDDPARPPNRDTTPPKSR